MSQRQPQVLKLSITNNMEPKLEWLQKRLHLDDNSLSKMIQRLPPILGMSIPDNLEPKLDWMQDSLSVTDEQLSIMIQRSPHVLSYSIHDNMEPKLDWFQNQLSLTDEQLSEMIQRYTVLFNYSIPNNLEPTLDFYIDALGEDEALALVTRVPASLMYSLEKRLQPRLKQALDTGMAIDSKLVSLIMMYTDVKWNRKVEIEMGKR